VAPGAIVLLSDGFNTVGRAPQQAAAEAKVAQVPVYTIAYGTENGYVDLDGKREPVPVDHQEMQQVARVSGGEYFSAASADQLKRVYQNIGSEVGYEKADREVTARFAGYGLALAVLAALGAISLGARWP
jgi:Ca-activated chloride channel family protein